MKRLILLAAIWRESTSDNFSATAAERSFVDELATIRQRVAELKVQLGDKAGGPEVADKFQTIPKSGRWLTVAEAQPGFARLPADGHSFASQMCGRQGHPRDWIFVQLGGKWYARTDSWKLNQSGELYDMSDAPFVEEPVAAESQSLAAKAARGKLQSVLGELNPAGGTAGTGTPRRPVRKFRRQQRSSQSATAPPWAATYFRALRTPPLCARR